MTQEQIDGCELIANFMEWQKDNEQEGCYNPPSEQIVPLNLFYTSYSPRSMKWYSSWDWIMLAWDKIRRTVFEKNDNSYPDPFAAMTDVWEMKCLLADRDTAFEVLVEAIKWHNTL